MNAPSLQALSQSERSKGRGLLLYKHKEHWSQTPICCRGHGDSTRERSALRRSWRLWDVLMECVRSMTDKILKAIRFMDQFCQLYSCCSFVLGWHCSSWFILTARYHSLKLVVTTKEQNIHKCVCNIVSRELKWNQTQSKMFATIILMMTRDHCGQ